MKTYFLLASLLIIMLLACSYEPPTQVAKNYSLNEILSDTNWVEITDTVDVSSEVRCIDYDLMNKGELINSEIDYIELWDESVKTKEDSVKMYNWGDCNTYLRTNIDYIQRSVVGITTTIGHASTYRNIFINKKNKEVYYLLQIKTLSGILINNKFYQWTSIPKIDSEFQLIFQTIGIQ